MPLWSIGFYQSKYFGDPFSSETDDKNNPCPSMDGNFGLVPKRSAGQGSGMTRHNDRFFLTKLVSERQEKTKWEMLSFPIGEHGQVQEENWQVRY